MAIYEFEYSEGCKTMYTGDFPVVDTYITGMVGNDCTNWDGTHYLMWMISVANDWGTETETGYSVWVVPVAEDLSSEFDTPHIHYTDFLGQEGLQRARKLAIELLQKAHEGELDQD